MKAKRQLLAALLIACATISMGQTTKITDT